MRDDTWLCAALIALCIAFVVEMVRFVKVMHDPDEESTKGRSWVISVYDTDGFVDSFTFYGSQRDVREKIRMLIQADMNVAYVDPERLTSSEWVVVGNSFRKVYDGNDEGSFQGCEWRAEVNYPRSKGR